MRGLMFAALAAFANLFGMQAALAETVELQGCPADRSKVGWLLMGRKQLGTTDRTVFYSPTGVTFFGDPVTGIFQANDNSTWLHIRLSRPREVYLTQMSNKYSAAAEVNKCSEGYEGCYIELKDDGNIYGLRSMDLSKFRGELETSAQPDGDYLVCLYR